MNILDALKGGFVGDDFDGIVRIVDQSQAAASGTDPNVSAPVFLDCGDFPPRETLGGGEGSEVVVRHQGQAAGGMT